MKIRKAELEDLNIIIEIFRNAINEMNENNIHQWDEIYDDEKFGGTNWRKGLFYLFEKKL